MTRQSTAKPPSPVTQWRRATIPFTGPVKPRKRSTRRDPPQVAGVLRHARQLQILNEIARIATQGLELRPMLQRITDAMRDSFGWEFVACVSIDRERRRFVCEALSSTAPTAVGVGYSRELGSGVVGEVASTGRTLVIDDVRSHANYIETMPGALSELCVPVMHGGRLIAILNVESRRQAAFRGRVGLLETVAEQVAGAIASARLYEELTRRAALLEILSEVSKTALEAVDLDSLLERVAAYVQRRLGFAVAAILLHDEARHELALAAFESRIPLRVSRGQRWPVNRGVIGRALGTGEPQLVLDVRADPDYVTSSAEITSELAVPIRFHNRILGVINVETTTPEEFSAETVQVLKTLADQAAGAVPLAAVNGRLADPNQLLRESNRRIEEAPATISRLAASSRGAAADVQAWSRAAAAEIARVIGSREIGLWEVEGGGVGPLAEGSTQAPSLEELRGAARNGPLRRGDDTVVPVTGMSGDLHGALVVAGRDLRWSDSERSLVAGFAHQLGGALEVRRMRRQLAAVEERRTATRRDMHERGIATLQICPGCDRCYDHTIERCPV